jgi:hypothetical protein
MNPLTWERPTEIPKLNTDLEFSPHVLYVRIEIKGTCATNNSYHCPLKFIDKDHALNGWAVEP